MIYKTIILALGCLLTVGLRAQTSYDSSFRFYYYDQKLSMFQTMPDRAGEVVWLGDSITDGGEWSELFPGVVTLNRGISADNTFGILYRIREITRRKPRKVFLLIGINDIARGIPDSVILYNYRRIVDSIRWQSPATQLYVQSLLPTNNAYSDFKNHQNKTEHIDYINGQLRQLCLQRKLVYVDLHAAFADKEGKLNSRYTNDGLHLTGAGYQRWKEVLLQKGCMK
jgi:lysophospholipase L1-like esterase